MIDDQFELRRLHYRQVRRLRALEDAIDVAGRPSKRINRISAVGNQAAAVKKEAASRGPANT